MTRKEFLYALENEGLIDCVRTDNKIDVEETLDSYSMESWCYTHGWEWLSCKKIYEIIDDLGGFED